jgi:signal transduction histidine kinase
MIIKPLGEYRFSLRARTTTWYVGLLAVALVVFSIAVYAGVRNYLKVSLHRGLISTGQTIASDYLDKLSTKGDAWVVGEIRESYEASASDHYIRISVGPRVLYQTADMRDPHVGIDAISLPKRSSAGAIHRQTVGGQVVMVYSLPYQAADGRLIEVEAGTSLLSMQQTLSSVTRILTLASIMVLIAATIGGYLLMKQPLRPLVVLTQKAANIGRKELGERLPVIRTGDELERLTHSLNGMIDRLEEALDHNHRFSADASHELRTPLTIMRGEIEEMLRFEDLPAQAVENLVSTLEEIDRMSRIVNSLMVITRLDAGGERMDLQVLDLSELVQTTMEHMRLLAEEKGLPLTCRCERGVYVYADRMRLKQVLVNLIDNALKYSRAIEAAEGLETEPSLPDESLAPIPLVGTSGGVEVRVFASDSRAILEIADKGIGISADVLPHVFDRFYRADLTRSRVAGGVGLGLAIVKAIITAHDGSVSLTSMVGEGSTVLVQLPLAPEQAAAEEQEVTSAREQPRYRVN